MRLAAITRWRPGCRSRRFVAYPQTAGRYRRRLGFRPIRAADGDAGRLLAAAFPIGSPKRRGEPGSFRLSGGGGARLPRTDRLANAGLLAVAALELKAAARIRLAAPLDADNLPPALAARVTEQVESGFDPVAGTVLARRRRRLGALILSDRTVPVDPAQVATSLADAVAAGRIAPAALDRRGAPVTGPRRADARHRAGRRVAGPDRMRRWSPTCSDWLAPHLRGWRAWPTCSGWILPRSCAACCPGIGVPLGSGTAHPSGSARGARRGGLLRAGADGVRHAHRRFTA